MELTAWERLATALLPFGELALRPGEVEHWFGSTFDVERIAGETDLPKWPRGWAYLLTIGDRQPRRRLSCGLEPLRHWVGTASLLVICAANRRTAKARHARH